LFGFTFGIKQPEKIIIMMRTGTVKFFNEAKGFGFIIDDASKEEFFVHASGLTVQIKEGDRVSFTIEKGKKGMTAVNVQQA
jgi:CspA family cold shock protein